MIYPEYNSNYDLIADYNKAIRVLAVDFVSAPFLDIDRYNPKAEDEKIMYNLIVISMILDYYFYSFTWFHSINNDCPFNGQTPWQHLIANKVKGLYETTFYLQALSVKIVPLLPAPVPE